MYSRKWLVAGCLVVSAVAVAAAGTAQAEPLSPLSPGEIQYLDQVRRVLTVSHDPEAFRSDGELLSTGRFACDKRTSGMVGGGATFVPPAITQVAFIYLCPN
jgi:hypothetical protein